MWSDGIPVTYKNFNAYHRFNYNNKDCVAISFYYESGSWYRWKCEFGFTFICKATIAKNKPI